MTFVVDTHALLWFLIGSARRGASARAALEDPHQHFVLPATALAEACWISVALLTGDQNITASNAVPILW